MMAVHLAGRRLRVRIEGNPALAAWLRRTYATSRVRPNGQADLEVLGDVVAGERHADREDQRQAAEWCLVARALERTRRSATLLHAAWVGSVLLGGPHACGKTTLALALARRHGWGLHADDVVILAGGGRLRPMERPVRVKRGDRAPAMIPLRGLARGPRVQPRVVAILDRRRAGGLRMRPLTSAEAIAALARLTWNFRERPRETLSALARFIRRARAFRLSGGTVDERCELICRTSTTT